MSRLLEMLPLGTVDYDDGLEIQESLRRAVLEHEIPDQLLLLEHPPVVTLDLSLNQLNPDDLGGLRLLERFLSTEPATRAIVITGNRADINAIRAVRLGACDFYTKPLRLDEIKILQCSFVFPENPFSTDELRHHHIRPVFLAQLPERRVGDARHGREIKREPVLEPWQSH